MELKSLLIGLRVIIVKNFGALFPKKILTKSFIIKTMNECYLIET